MDKYLKQQLKAWAYDKIVSNPKKFGGDFGNAHIMYAYLIEFYGSSLVNELEEQQMSILSTISRDRNKLLLKHPELDCRIKHKAKVKSNAVGNKS